MLLFGAGMQALVLAGNLELLFVGWEIVGMTSVLLVGFFHERLGAGEGGDPRAGDVPPV